MAKSNVPDWDTTAGNNTDVGGTSIAENCGAAGINNAMREFMAQLKREIANKGSDIASASTCSIAASGTSGYAVVTGTTAITSFGTAPAGTFRIVEFADALTLTHHATALILPGLTNITTAAGDIAELVSLGSGNWKCTGYTRQSGEVVGGFSSVTATSTDAGAGAGPDISVFRNSASPADNDLIGRFLFEGRDESSNRDIYASLEGKILDATGGTEDAEVYLKTVVAGTLAARLTAGQGILIGAATGGDPGANKINAAGYKLNGIEPANTILQRVRFQTQSADSTTTDIPSDSTAPRWDEGKQFWSQSFTPKVATSTIEIEISFSGGSATTGTELIVSLFKDASSGTDTAVAVGVEEVASNGACRVDFTYSETAGSTSARTYAARFGTPSGTARMNSTNAGDTMGGKYVTSVTVTEYAA